MQFTRTTMQSDGIGKTYSTNNEQLFHCRSFTAEFIKHFCLPNGAIDWNKLVELNSGIPKPKIKKVKTLKI